MSVTAETLRVFIIMFSSGVEMSPQLCAHGQVNRTFTRLIWQGISGLEITATQWTMAGQKKALC